MGVLVLVIGYVIKVRLVEGNGKESIGRELVGWEVVMVLYVDIMGEIFDGWVGFVGIWWSEIMVFYEIKKC